MELKHYVNNRVSADYQFCSAISASIEEKLRNYLKINPAIKCESKKL